MTETSAPWGGTTLGDAGPYTDQDWAKIWREAFNSSDSDSGVLVGTGTAPDPGLTVQATGPASASVDITAGSALVQGTWYNTDANVNKTIGANASGNPRIDTVVLRKDFATQTVRLAVLPGTPAGSPVPPALTQTDGVTWEMPLADVAVANGFATITNADITPRAIPANGARGVYLDDILNNSGATLQTGDVVVWDYTANRAVKTSTTLGDQNIAGVWQGRTPAGGYGRVLRLGIGYVYVNAAVASRGLTLCQSGTAKQAAINTGGPVLGFSLATTGGAGLCLAYIDTLQPVRAAPVTYMDQAANGSTTGTTFVDVNAAHAFVTITPRTGRVKVTMMFFASSLGTSIGFFDIRSQGLAARAGDANNGLTIIPNGSFSNITLVAIFSGLTPGTAQEFRLQFKGDVAGQTVSTSATFTAFAEDIG